MLNRAVLVGFMITMIADWNQDGSRHRSCSLPVPVIPVIEMLISSAPYCCSHEPVPVTLIGSMNIDRDIMLTLDSL